MGAHPGAPSTLVLGETALSLASAVAAHPAEVLGEDCLRRFGARLPFLLKVLAVERALSIQVHPDATRAAAGFRAERDTGIPIGQGTYADPFPKPEMLLALDEFWALAGLRSVDEIASLLGVLGLPELDHTLRTAHEEGPASALSGLATHPAPEREALAATIRASVERKLPTELDPGTRTVLDWIRLLSEQRPTDPMVLAPCLLHLHRLSPGGTLFLPAGVPHAYLSGNGIEIMGASDNVIRAGLTTKRVDTAALRLVVDPTAQPVLDVPYVAVSRQELRWTPPVEEFTLGRIDLDGGTFQLPAPATDRTGPGILFCLNGSIRLGGGDGRTLELGGGQSAFLTGTSTGTSATGTGTLFHAAAGRPHR